MVITKILGKTLGLTTALTIGAIGGIYATAIAYATQPDDLVEALDYFKGKYDEKLKEAKPKIDKVKETAKAVTKSATDKIMEEIDKAMNPSIEHLMEELQKQADTLTSMSPDFRYTAEDDEKVYGTVSDELMPEDLESKD